MIGFQHSSHADVNLITDNLRDRYKDLFSILKELVQNAYDAGSAQLRFGIVPGDSGHTQALLRGPGLVAVNDGAFRKTDYQAVGSQKAFFRSRHDTALEILALRQQVAVLKRKRSRPCLNHLDRIFWTTLRHVWSRWVRSWLL